MTRVIDHKAVWLRETTVRANHCNHDWIITTLKANLLLWVQQMYELDISKTQNQKTADNVILQRAQKILKFQTFCKRSVINWKTETAWVIDLEHRLAYIMLRDNAGQDVRKSIVLKFHISCACANVSVNYTRIFLTSIWKFTRKFNGWNYQSQSNQLLPAKILSQKKFDKFKASDIQKT